MARSFNGSSDAISAAVNLGASTVNQITVSFWLNWTTSANNDDLACEYSPNYGSNSTGFICDVNSSGPSAGGSYFGYNDSSITTAEFTRPSTGVWHNWICLFDATKAGAAVIPAIYIDGVSQSITNTNTGSIAGSFLSYNLNFMCRNGASLFGTGSMADFAIWAANSGSGQGALLSAGEAKAIANGARPWTIRPTNLRNYWPLDGLQSPEPDLSGSANKINGTLAGTALTFGPPLMMFTPRTPLILPNTAAAAQAFQPAWAMRNRIVVEGIGI